MATAADIEAAFYLQYIDDPDAKHWGVSTLKRLFYMGVLSGEIVLGGGGEAADITGLAPKNMVAGIRQRTGVAQDGAWEARPTGYKTVIAIGVDPDPADHGEFDLRFIPVV